MRIAFLSILALSGLSLTSASPVLDRRADAISILTDLYATIQTYTGAISQSSLYPFQELEIYTNK